MTTLVEGDLHLVTDDPMGVREVLVRAPHTRTHGTGLVGDWSDKRRVEGGRVSIPLLPGPVVMTLMQAGRPTQSVDLLVPEADTATLKQCMDAAALADNETRSALERLAGESAAAVTQTERDANRALTAAGDANRAQAAAESAAGTAGEHREAAAESAGRAGTSETAAEGFARDAATSEENAVTSATDARGHAETAEGAASRSEESASAAATDAARVEGLSVAADGDVAATLAAGGESTGLLHATYYRRRRGETRTFYVRADGDDATGDGSASRPFREIRTAVNSLAQEGPVLTGSIVIDVGAGEYKGGVRLPLTRGQGQDDFLTIKGPSVGGHPNAPAAVISHSQDTSATYGILATDGWYLWVEDIAINGPFGTGLDVRNYVTLQRRNVHVDGAAIGVNLTSYVMDNARGGIIQNCTTYGVQEMYNITRSYTGGIGGGTIHRNCGYGIYSKVYTGGHLDNAVFENCGVAIHIDRGSANLSRVAISGAATAGITLKDAEIHNESSITWGAGNARRIISFGASTSESDMWGWSGPGGRNGIKPPNFLVRSTYTPKVVTGVTSAIYLTEWLSVLPADRLTVQGRKIRVDMIGRLNTYARGEIPLQLLIGGQVAQSLIIPAAEAAGMFMATWTMTCTADGNNQMFIGELKTGSGTIRSYYGVKNIDLTAADRTVGIRATPAHANDNVEMIAAELYG